MKYKQITLIGLLSLTACTAENTNKEEVHNKYLACYALDPSAKQQCLQEIQFEGEKLGFKQFLNKLGLECGKIEESPLFDEEQQAYRVKCVSNRQYWMQFNYETKEWKLIKGE